ncbi:phage virion morphogenesis protein [Tistrella bauzanensis]|uniref:phage virion morphogenesis protein n=1 Tax=Tistrella TaxID=171436 RepID=UPI0031F5FB41
MSGAGLSITDQLSGALQALVRGLDQPDSLITNIGVLLVQSTKDRFLAGQGPDGIPWAPLNPLYAATKKGPGILREAGAFGGLMSTIVWQRDGATALIVGTNRIYAAAHQFGAVIVPKTAAALVFGLGEELIHAQSVTIPAREFLGVSETDQEGMIHLATDYVASLAGQRPA